MKEKELFWNLYNSHYEHEIEKIISQSEMNNQENWKPYGGREGNFGTFESQQNNPVQALVEKITNSIDAILIKECKLKGLEPESKKVPASMKKAVELFYKVKNGEIGELDNISRRKMAEDIQVLAFGDEKQPSLVIYDNGEGQKPEDFGKTFLSLHRNNKNKINFVQGKYNMGSTGAVVFCGENKYQLIASKRSLSLYPNCKLGFTLVRRHPLTKEEDKEYKSTWYEYFCPNSRIPSFSIDEIDIGLVNRKFTNGSIIKLYQYQLPRGSRSNIELDLWRELNQFMFDLPLPLIVFEKRDCYKKYILGKLLLGNRTRITIDQRNKVEKTISLNIKDSTIGTVDIQAFIFQKGTKHSEFIRNKSIVFTLNGQVHGFEGQSFISQDLGFSLLKRDLLIHVDCTKIPTSIRQDLFMANRTQLKQSPKYDELKDEITQKLGKDDTLRAINNERKNAIFQNTDSDELITDLLSKLPVDDYLTNLLKKDGTLNFPKQRGNKTNSVKEEKQKKLNRFPSIFKLRKSKKGKIYKTIPLNSQGKIFFETDVEDDYLFRPSEKGNFHVEVLQKRNHSDTEVKNPNPNPNEVVDVITVDRAGPTDGTIKLMIKPTQKAQVGDEIEIQATLSSPGGNMSCAFMVKVDEKISPSTKQEQKKTESPPKRPNAQKAYKNPKNGGVAWAEFSWGGDDIVKVITKKDEDSGEQLVDGIVINMDAFVLKQFVVKNRIKDEKGLKSISNKYFLSIYLHSLYLYSIFHKMQKKDNELNPIQVDEFISSVMKPYSNVLLYENYHMTEAIFEE